MREEAEAQKRLFAKVSTQSESTANSRDEMMVKVCQQASVAM